jgi:hypothetical protein
VRQEQVKGLRALLLDHREASEHAAQAMNDALGAGPRKIAVVLAMGQMLGEQLAKDPKMADDLEAHIRMATQIIGCAALAAAGVQAPGRTKH